MPEWALDSLRSFEQRTNSPQAAHSFKKIDRRPFDPNQSTYDELMALGIPSGLSNRILNYRKKGGRFRKNSDLRKIYGMNDSLYDQLSPYIRIENKSKEDKVSSVKSTPTSFRLKKHIDLNLADTNDLIQLRGIGQIYSKRIIAYRTALGGFHNVEQLKEVYGINDSLFQSLKDDIELGDAILRKIEINHVGLDELRKHPYFRNYKLARAIINFREHHGAFRNAESMRSLYLMNDSILFKVRPYLEFSFE